MVLLYRHKMRFDMGSRTLALEAAQRLRQAGYDALAPKPRSGTGFVSVRDADTEAESVARIVRQVDKSASRTDRSALAPPTEIRITVRDARIGRDPSLVTDQGGAVLMEYTRRTMHEDGDVITLLDGTEVDVIHCGEKYSQDEDHPSQIVRVGTHRPPAG
jgi:hypothetical protein